MSETFDYEFKLYSSFIKFPDGTQADRLELDLTMYINRIEIRRDIMKHGAFATVTISVNHIDFIPPQSVFGIQFESNYEGPGTEKYYGFLGIVYDSSGTAISDEIEDAENERRSNRTFTFQCADMWSVLSGVVPLKTTLDSSTMTDFISYCQGELSGYQSPYGVVKLDKFLDFIDLNIDNTETYEFLTVPNNTYISMIQEFQNIYGIYNSTLFMYSECDTSSTAVDTANAQEAARYTFISSMDNILNELSPAKKITLGIGNLDEKFDHRIQTGTFPWRLKSRSILELPTTSETVQSTPQLFFNDVITKDYDSMSGGSRDSIFEYGLNLEKFANEFTFSDTETAINNKLDKTIPRLTITVNPDRWIWEDFRPGNLVDLKINSDPKTADLLNGKWVLTNNTVIINIANDNVTIEKNEISLVKNFTKAKTIYKKQDIQT